MYRRLQKAFKNSRVGGTDVNVQKVRKGFNNSRVGGSEPKVTERFQEFQSSGKTLKMSYFCSVR